MKTTVCCLALLVAVGAVPATDYYKTNFETSLSDVLKSDRLLGNYFNCLMDKGKCTPDAQALKVILPEALQTSCKKCSPKQEDEVLKAVKFLQENKPAMWKALEAKFDPQGVLRAAAKTEPKYKKYNLKF